MLFDRGGWLVEGAGSNVVAVLADGELVTPPLSRGAVAGIALQVLTERVSELRERDLRQEDLRAARALICTNAVRGARPVTRLDGEALPGAEDPWVERLAQTVLLDP